MKTTEDIKKGLEYLGAKNVAEKVSLAKQVRFYILKEDIAADALAYIQQLEAERDSALSLIGKLAVILKNFPRADAKECVNKAYNAVENWMLFDMRMLAQQMAQQKEE